MGAPGCAGDVPCGCGRWPRCGPDRWRLGRVREPYSFPFASSCCLGCACGAAVRSSAARSLS